MHEYTGEILTSEQVEKLSTKHREQLIGIPDEALSSVQAMNRHERRKWAAEQRKLLRKSPEFRAR